MSNQMLLRFCRFSFLSLLNSSSHTTLSSLSSSIRPVHTYTGILTPTRRAKVSLKRSLRRSTPASFDNVNNVGSHGSVRFVMTPEGKQKFEIQEIDPPILEKRVIKKRLQVKRRRERRKRLDANYQDPRGRNKKPTGPSAEERLKDKLERAKMKEASLVKRLKRYEENPVQGPIAKPHELTAEEKFYLERIGQKRSNYVPVGRRGIYGGVILNMHMHWKKHETVKVICEHCKPGQLEEYTNVIARLSGGFPVKTVGKDTIIFYRGKYYEQPEVMSPVGTLSKRKALQKSKDEQALATVRHVIEIVEKELELYYRHMALYDDDPMKHNPHTRLRHSTGSRDSKRLKDTSVDDVRSQVLCTTEAANLICQEGTEDCNVDENAVQL